MHPVFHAVFHPSNSTEPVAVFREFAHARAFADAHVPGAYLAATGVDLFDAYRPDRHDDRQDLEAAVEDDGRMREELIEKKNELETALESIESVACGECLNPVWERWETRSVRREHDGTTRVVNAVVCHECAADLDAKRAAATATANKDRSTNAKRSGF